MLGRSQHQPKNKCLIADFYTAINASTPYYYFTIDRLEKSLRIKK